MHIWFRTHRMASVLALIVWAIPASAAEIASTTLIPICTQHVDASAAQGGNGSAVQPWPNIAAAMQAAEPGAIICVAEGEYSEQLLPGTKPFTLAGGFQRGSGFNVRDSGRHVSKAVGKGGSFLKIVDPGPVGNQLTAIDGFDISGYSQAILRDHWESQRFDLTHNVIHGNTCENETLAGAGFALVNVSGTISGNIIRGNACGRGGAGFLNDSTNQNTVVIDNNIISRNAGTEPTGSHGGALYLFGNTLEITNNLFTDNTVTQWGAGLYIGAYTPGNQPTTATMTGNVYRGNKAGDGGGGFFCDDGATCNLSHEIFNSNCGGNILLDGGSQGSGPTTAAFDHITNVFAKTADCSVAGAGVFLDTHEGVAPDSYVFTNSLFWGNAKDGDFVTACNSGCADLRLSVDTSMVQTTYGDGSVKISFGAGNMAPADPQFVRPEAGDFSLTPSTPATGLGAIRDKPPLAEAAAEVPVAAAPTELPAKPKQPVTLVPSITRGGMYMGFPEQFNRYYTDKAWVPSRVVFASPGGGGDGTNPDAPLDAKAAIAGASPGTLIFFRSGSYEGGWELTKELSGVPDNPIVLFAELAVDGGIGVQVDCNVGKRKTCINLEGADHIAVRGFELVGGNYGVRVVGLGFDASQHSRGIAVIGNIGHDQERDPFFSGQSDWNIWENNLAYGAKEGDGHGIYISNGSDWNIVRHNETHSNASSNFQVNADPASTCAEDGIAFNDPRCDAYAGEGEGGRGASDYFLVENNYFHHDDVGPNFTSVRRSVIRNNIFGLQARHNVSFWQETDNPKLGSSDNIILHNLFIATRRHGVQFSNHATRNMFANNVILGLAPENGSLRPDPEALLLEIADPPSENFFSSNFYGAGKIQGRTLGANEMAVQDFSLEWFARFPLDAKASRSGFAPSPLSPYIKAGRALSDAPLDINGTPRSGKVELGPFAVP